MRIVHVALGAVTLCVMAGLPGCKRPSSGVDASERAQPAPAAAGNRAASDAGDPADADDSEDGADAAAKPAAIDPRVPCPPGTTQERNEFGLLSIYCVDENELSHGPSKAWYSGGQLEEEETYVHGRLEGIQRYWHENGVLKSVKYHRHGKLEGTSKSWHPNGKPESIFHWHNDKSVGLSQWFDERGRLVKQQHEPPADASESKDKTAGE